MTWPRDPIEYSFDRDSGDGREHADDVGLDGTAERRGRERGPRIISRGRLRQIIFPRPGAVHHRQEDLEMGEVGNVHRGRSRVVSAAEEGPSVAHATGHHQVDFDLEGQRERRRTTEAGEVMG